MGVGLLKQAALGQRAERTDTSIPHGGTLDEYYDASGALAMVANNANPVIDYIPGVGGRDYVKYQAGATFFMHTNALGSAALITSAANSKVQDEIFYPWGQQWNLVENWGANYSEQFASLKERDPESGLDPTQNRMFTSQWGRWLTPDPLGGHVEDPQTLNRYVYARNNPLTLTDSTGLDFYLSCDTASDTCQKDAAGNLVQGTTTETTDAAGHTTSSFSPTVVTSASLQDPNSGNTAMVNEKGVQITTTDAEGNQSTAEGIFINKTPAADIQGSGKLSDFQFHIDSSDEKSGTLDAGRFSFNGTRDQTRATLDERGAFRGLFDKRWLFGRSPDELRFHHDSTQHRFGEGPSPHFSVPDDPRNTVPTTGPFHVDRDVGMRHAACAVFGVSCD